MQNTDATGNRDGNCISDTDWRPAARSVDFVHAAGADRPAKPFAPGGIAMSTIQSVMHENRVFEPSPAWVAQANIQKAAFD